MPNQPVSTNTPTAAMRPERNELNGKVPTSAQYTNWMRPIKTVHSRNESVILICTLVSFLYAVASDFQAASADCDPAAEAMMAGGTGGRQGGKHSVRADISAGHLKLNAVLCYSGY